MNEEPKTINRKLILLLLLAMIGGLGLLVALWLGIDVRGLVVRGLEFITRAGPLAFFGAMAVMPLFGVPLLTFVLTAGPAFGKQFGLPTVVFFSLVAITVNMVISYFLARRAFRPLLSKLVARLGHSVPELKGGDATDLLVILRVTPGIPFFVQNYIAGLANVPLLPYLYVSCIVAWIYNAAFVVFGDALLHGQSRMIILALGGIVAVVALTHMVRRHYAGRKVVS